MSDIIDVIRQDHAEIRRLFGRLEQISPGERLQLFREIVSELARHEAAEEAIVHPMFQDVGDEVSARAILDEERDAEEMMANMEDLDPTGPDFLAAFRRLRDDVISHADHEEREEHPRLSQFVDMERRAEMARRFERIKKLAPTRPHPHAPDGRVAQLTVGPVAGVFDRARDAVRDLMSSDSD